MANTDLIIANLSRYIRLTPDEEKAFIARVEPRTIKRKSFLLHKGEVCDWTAFVNSGCLRSYIYDQNGFEHILQFAPTDWWISDIASYLSSEPGSLFIDALMDTEILLLHRTALNELYDTTPKYDRFFRLLSEKSLVTHQRRLLENLSLPATQRFENFCKRYPTLIKTLPQKQIASFIGVTPEFFSKMRKDLSRKPQ